MFNSIKACCGALVSLFFTNVSLAASSPDFTSRHSAAIGESVLRLLQSQDVAAFARDLAVTNQFNRTDVSNSAQLVLAQAARMGIAPSRVHFRVKEVLAKATGSGRNPESQDNGDMLPTSFGIRIILTGEPAKDIQADKPLPLQGEYELALGGAFEFPDGWRTYEGIHWSRFPDGLADERTKREVALVSNLCAHMGEPLRSADDIALAGLGDTLARFLSKHDEKIFADEVMRSFKESWEKLERKLNTLNVKERPSKQEFEGAWNTHRRELLESARRVLAQTEILGIDFSGAEITLKDATASLPYMRGGYGSVDGITAEQFQFTFSVKSNQKSKSGQPIAGDYTLRAGHGERGPDKWTITDKIWWGKFPDGLLGQKELEVMAFEDYVGQYGTLPSGTSVPDIEFIRLGSGRKSRLSEFRGKMVVLEWWATWCGPCQMPMADLQTLADYHPDWKGKVEIITLSIDDEIRQPEQRVAKQGWTNTFNAWAGPGGWMSAPAKQFRLRGVPTCYVIDPQGKVMQAGDPSGLSLTNAAWSPARLEETRKKIVETAPLDFQ